MRKLIFPILALCLLCSCSAKKAAAPYATAQAQDLLTCGAFEGSDMAALDSDILLMLYGIEDASVEEAVGYTAANTFNSADELAIFVCGDESAAQAVEAACKARMEQQISQCVNYCPAAVPRLEQALISRRGSTVLLMAGDPDVIAAQTDIH